jgi:glycosyltransferase involved in cell wall biosynthesis
MASISPLRILSMAPGPRDGSDSGDPVRILSVGRAVEKKGYDVLLKALSLLPSGLHWRFAHIGDGDNIKKLKSLATELGIADRIDWKGALDQKDVLAAISRSPIFLRWPAVSPADGDRDGLPNVMVEASSQGLVCDFDRYFRRARTANRRENGLIVPPEDPAALAAALETAIRDRRISPPARPGCRKARAHGVRFPFQYPPVEIAVRDSNGRKRMTAMHKPYRVFFYVQHLLGIGHLARASRIARALAEDGFDVTMVTGGTPVSGFPGPEVRHLALP